MTNGVLPHGINWSLVIGHWCLVISAALILRSKKGSDRNQSEPSEGRYADAAGIIPCGSITNFFAAPLSKSM
jgi:hypothetical protein